MTSTDYDFQSGRDTLIKAAFRKVGAVSYEQDPSATQISLAADVLNRIVKSWAGKRIFLWTLVPIEVTLNGTLHTTAYTVGSDVNVIGIDKVLYRDANGDTPMDVISYRDYQDIPQKTSTGTPRIAAWDPIAKKIMVWPAPTASDKVYGLFVTRPKDYDATGSIGDFPVEYERALLYALSADLGDDFGIPMTEINAWRGEALIALNEAARTDRNTADLEFVKSAY